MDSGRQSPLDVAKKWIPWSLGLILSMTVGWVALVAYAEVSSGKHDNLIDTSIAVGSVAGMAAPLIPLFSIVIITAADLTGGAIVVTYNYLNNKFVKPLIEKHKAEGRALGREEGITQGIELGRQEIMVAIRDWNNRRLDAEEKGEPFDEPPPGL